MMDSTAPLEVACIVVHFESVETLSRTLTALAAAGVPPERTIVVDNSISPQARYTASEIASDACTQYLSIENRGYAAAANQGLLALKASGRLGKFVLVSTHESLPAGDAVERMLTALARDERIAAAGPVLTDSDRVGKAIWSGGGRLTRVLKRPRHLGEPDLTESGPLDRAWLDGAFVLYRSDLLVDLRFDEDYFLYFEEVDLHVRLSKLGHRVVIVPTAYASQSSKGIPPRLLGQNLFLFEARHFGRLRGRVGVGYECIRAFVRKLLTGKGTWNAPRDMVLGWLDGERIHRMTDAPPRALARRA